MPGEERTFADLYDENGDISQEPSSITPEEPEAAFDESGNPVAETERTSANLPEAEVVSSAKSTTREFSNDPQAEAHLQKLKGEGMIGAPAFRKLTEAAIQQPHGDAFHIASEIMVLGKGLKREELEEGKAEAESNNNQFLAHAYSDALEVKKLYESGGGEMSLFQKIQDRINREKNTLKEDMAA